MNRVGDEVSEECEHHLLDLDVALEDVDEPETVAEKHLRPPSRLIEVVVVQAAHEFALDRLFDVPVRCDHERGCLRGPVLGARRDGEGLERLVQRHHCLETCPERLILLHEELVLGLGVVGFHALARPLDVFLYDFVDWFCWSVLLLALDTHAALAVFDRRHGDTESG